MKYKAKWYKLKIKNNKSLSFLENKYNFNETFKIRKKSLKKIIMEIFTN